MTQAEVVELHGGLRRKGREWVGPCPLCGGEDRFYVLPDGGFYCRHCLTGGDRDRYVAMLKALGAEMPARRTEEDRRAEAERRARMRAEAVARHGRAARRASRWIREASRDTHPYLAAKGFPEERWLVRDGSLVVPMMDRRGRVMSIQTITPTGEKRFLYGGATAGARFDFLKPRGRRHITWYVEGLATAFSVRAALHELCRTEPIVVCFSAANLRIARERPGPVLADHDWWACRAPPDGCGRKWSGPWPQDSCPDCGEPPGSSPAGERYAIESGQYYWIPPVPGTDPNDYHLEHGIEPLVQACRTLADAYKVDGRGPDPLPSR